MVCILPFLAFIAICASMSTHSLYAQRVAVAPIIQGGVNAPYAGFPSLSDAPQCCSDIGIGAGASGSIGLEVLTDVATAFSVSLRGMIGGSRDVLWTRDQIGWTMQRTPNGNKVYPAYSTYVLDLSSSVVDASVLFNIRPREASPWQITAGAGLTSPMSVTYDQYEVFDADPALILADSRLPQRDTSTGDASSSASPFGRFIGGVRYERSLSASTQLIYDFTVNVGLSPVLSAGGGSLASYSLRATIGLMFDVLNRSTVPEPPLDQKPEPISEPIVEPTPEPIPTPTPEPVAEVKQEVLELIPIVQPTVAQRIKPEPEPEPAHTPIPEPDVALTTAYQLIPYVFFAPGNSSLQGNVNDVQCSDNQRTVVEDLIDTALTIDTYTEKHYQINQQLLNIIGYRMQVLYPRSRLVINGYVNGRSSDEVAGIGLARATSVASYLKDCWQIEPHRVTIASSDGMSPTACTYALRDQSDMHDAEEENSRCELTSPNESMLLAPVLAGVSIPCSRLEGANVTSIVRLCAAGRSMASESQLVRSVVELDGTSTATCVVTGYTDRKGPDNINERISEQRARKAAALIGGAAGKVTIDWIGEGARGMRAPYTNDSPLGRLLNRCAEVRRTWTVSRQP